VNDDDTTPVTTAHLVRLRDAVEDHRRIEAALVTGGGTVVLTNGEREAATEQLHRDAGRRVVLITEAVLAEIGMS
jgi:actin-like ATPase involved in cell morphogenesis